MDEKWNPVTTGRATEPMPFALCGYAILEFKDVKEAKARIRRVGDLRKPYYIIKVIEKVGGLFPDI